jgi:small subunit ribosomal protein S17
MARTITGVVTSDRGDKTIVITVHTRKTHPIYKKQYTVSTKFMAHDEKNEAKEGDKVIITVTRPLSARKRFILTKVVEKARTLHVEPEVESKKTKKSAAAEEEK